ncbi:MAG: phytase, partial [Acidobacteria bacterium]|nr:phytase [Acidobacteriota bacterium]
MKTHWLATTLASCAVAFAGCSPGTVVRCALTDLMTPEPEPQPADTRTVAATAETTPVPDACDAADDPAVWVDQSDPEASLIVATNKLRGLVVYGLDGAVVSTNDVGRVNNVDLRDGVDVGGEETIVVAATNRTTWTIDVLGLDPDRRDLTPLLHAPTSPHFSHDP